MLAAIPPSPRTARGATHGSPRRSTGCVVQIPSGQGNPGTVTLELTVSVDKAAQARLADATRRSVGELAEAS
jgi:hypothetical protein